MADSLRQAVFYDGLQDLRALQLCESLYGRDYTVALLEKDIDPITFTVYPHSDSYLPELRSRLNAAIKAALAK